jgi:hypothetical protein
MDYYKSTASFVEQPTVVFEEEIEVPAAASSSTSRAK